MGLKFLLFCAILGFSWAQETTIGTTLGTTTTVPVPPTAATCTYVDTGSDYLCYLDINNPNGEEIAIIGGVHTENRTDADVTYVYRMSGVSTIIPLVICSQFPNTMNIDLTNMGLVTVGENVLAGCTNLMFFRIWVNRVASLPENLFANNPGVTYIDIDNNLLTTLPENIFAPLLNLTTLEIRNNPYEIIPSGIFRSQANLLTLIMDGCRINNTNFNTQWFVPLVNLQTLYIGNNLFTTTPPSLFANLPRLLALEFSSNSQLQEIQGNAFSLLTSLSSLYLQSNRIVEVNPLWFANLTNLQVIYLNFNLIEDLPDGVFASVPNLFGLGLWANQIKTLRREYFGNLNNLYYMDLDQNMINGLDRRIFEDAQNSLFILYFWGNICASGYFFDFIGNRQQNLQRLERCFRNFEFSVDTTTEGGDRYRFYRFPEPGIFARVIAPQDVHISLNPVDFEATPRMEIQIGIANNTRSVIRRNGSENVVDISTPGILDPSSFSGFRVVFSNWMILVFREGEPFPFMGYNVEEFYPISHYGIRTPGNVVPWSIQPLDAVDPNPLESYQ